MANKYEPSSWQLQDNERWDSELRKRGGWIKRYDHNGTIDDLYIPNVEHVRVEVMHDRLVWMSFDREFVIDLVVDKGPEAILVSRFEGKIAVGQRLVDIPISA